MCTAIVVPPGACAAGCYMQEYVYRKRRDVIDTQTGLRVAGSRVRPVEVVVQSPVANASCR